MARARAARSLPDAGEITGTVEAIPFDSEELLEQPALVQKAVETVWVAMGARTVKTAQLGRKYGDGDLDRKTTNRLNTVFGRNRWMVLGQRLFWVEMDVGSRIAGSREVLSRVQPLPHRVNAERDRVYRVTRIDQNTSEVREIRKKGAPLVEDAEYREVDEHDEAF